MSFKLLLLDRCRFQHFSTNPYVHEYCFHRIKIRIYIILIQVLTEISISRSGSIKLQDEQFTRNLINGLNPQPGKPKYHFDTVSLQIDIHTFQDEFVSEVDLYIFEGTLEIITTLQRCFRQK